MVTNTIQDSQEQGLTPVVPDSLEAEIRRVAFQGQTRQKLSEIPSQPTS
jgi:hypothetical protein